MANAPNATSHKTPPRAGGSVFSPEIKSTPNAIGTAVISENMHTIGTNVDDIRPWIMRDIKDHRTCGIDEMLRELLHRCSHQPDTESESGEASQDKDKLLKSVFQDVLELCDEPMKKEMTKHSIDFVNCTGGEISSYEPFVRAANYALGRLSKLKAHGITPHDDSPDTNILVHRNDMPIKQKHQGVESQRKPDIVVVSHKTAREVYEEETKHSKHQPSMSNATKRRFTSDVACNKPKGRFQWPDVLSTFEFKRSHNPKMTFPKYDKLKVSTPDWICMRYGQSESVIQPTGSAPAAVRPGSAPVSLRRSSRLASSSGAKKRPSDNQGSDERGSKRMKSYHEKRINENRDNERVTKRIDPMEQNGLYAAEMFAAHVARQHVLSFVVNDDMIYIWYFDRQDAIQSCGFSFIHDLPRFLVLLLIMQRMQYAEWGHNPLFEPEPGCSGKVNIEGTEIGTVDLEFDFYSPERITHYGLRGRATNVFPVKSEALSRVAQQSDSRNTSDELVAKIYWPEEARQSEAEILAEVDKIAAERSEVKDHVPEVIWCHKFEETSTATIREALGIDKAQAGSRVLYIIVFRKLQPITKLSGDEFLSAWWHAVVCHRVLWERNVRHRDVSPSNLMFYRDSSGKVIGVLNDYDLSSMKDVPSGRERTGTVPFMALDLLRPAAIEGKVEHLYQHDAESFIWVFTWVCLHYEDGKYRSDGRPLDVWLTVDANGCHKEKHAFLGSGRHDVQPSSSHESNWLIAQSCLRVLSYLYADPREALRVEDVFEEWFKRVPLEIKSS